MKLYHYSQVKREVLKTLRMSGSEIVVSDRFDPYQPLTAYHPGAYVDHISFFLERPPIESLASVFKEGHSVWYKGNVVFEHVIETRDDNKFEFVVVETPERTDHYYDELYGDGDDEAWRAKELEILKKFGYIGEGSRSLERATDHLKGETLRAYQKLRGRPNFEQIRLKYAATVPHVMLYPDSGGVTVRSVTRLKVGDKPFKAPVVKLPKW